MLQAGSLQYSETFRTFVNKGVHALSAILLPAFGRDSLTICFNMLNLKILHNGKLLQRVAVLEGLPNDELYFH